LLGALFALSFFKKHALLLVSLDQYYLDNGDSDDSQRKRDDDGQPPGDRGDFLIRWVDNLKMAEALLSQRHFIEETGLQVSGEGVPFASSSCADSWNVDVVIIQIDLNVIVFAIECRSCILRFVEFNDN
jgi:hypothetical protein